MRRWILLLLILICATQAAAQYESQTVFAIRRSGAAAAWTTVNGDSGSVAALYPCDNGALADSAGRRIDLTWNGSFGGWVAEVDTTNDYSVFYRTGCCAETLATALQCRRLWGPNWPASIINNPLAFSGSVLVDGLIAAREDSGVVLADTLTANTLRALSSLVVQPGTTDLVRIDDAGVRLIGVGIAITTGEIDQTGGGYTTTGVVEAGFAASDIHDFTGIVSATNDVTSGDDVTVGDDLTVTDNATLGNADGDVTATQDLTVADDATITDQLTVNGFATLGDAATDLTAVQDLNVADDATFQDNAQFDGSGSLGNSAGSDSWQVTAAISIEGTATAEDSLRIGTDFGAADSLKSAARLNGWLELSAGATNDVSLANGVSSALSYFPGLRANDCFWCCILATSGATTTSQNYRLSVPFNGVLKVERPVATNALDLRCYVMKN